MLVLWRMLMIFGEDQVIHMDLAWSFPRNNNMHPEKFVMFKEMVGGHVGLTHLHLASDGKMLHRRSTHYYSTS